MTNFLCFFFAVSHNLKFNGSVMNPCKKASCSHLCLLIPNGGFRCGCPEGSSSTSGAPDKCDSGEYAYLNMQW